MSTAYLCVLLVLCGTIINASAQSQTILEVLRNQTQFSDFAGSLNVSAPLQARLGNASVESTVFAPVNQKPPFSLNAYELAYHVADGLYLVANLSQDAADGLLIPTLLIPNDSRVQQQLKVSIDNGTVSINGVAVQKTSIPATNGVVYALASVLALPDPLAKVLDAFPTFKSLLTAANITIPPVTTVFAPTEQAFNNLKKDNPALYGYLNSRANGSQDDLRLVLNYHMLPEVLYAQDIRVGEQNVNTRAGPPITITKSVVNNTSEVTVNGTSSSARVEAVNSLAYDGVLHTIDGVVVPQFEFTLKKILIGLNDTTLLRLLDQANLTKCLTDPCQYTIFAPTQEAWQKADQSDYSSSTQLVDVLRSHIYPHALDALPNNGTLVMLNNKTVHIVNGSLTLEGKANLGSAHVVGKGTKGFNGYVYSINQVLGVALSSDDSLSKATIGWIIVGAMGGILLLAGAIVAIVWYVKRKRTGYEVINGAV